MAQLPAQKNQQTGMTQRRRQQQPFELIRRQFDDLFDRMFDRMWGGGMTAPFMQDYWPTRSWDFDISEKDQEIIVRAEMPGFEENEIDVQLNNDVLTISGEKQQQGDGAGEEYRRFYRSITLPSGIDMDKVQANYRNGVLELRIPRTAGAGTKHIPVRGHQQSQPSQPQRLTASPSSGGTQPGNESKQGQKGSTQTAQASKS